MKQNRLLEKITFFTNRLALITVLCLIGVLYYWVSQKGPFTPSWIPRNSLEPSPSLADLTAPVSVETVNELEVLFTTHNYYLDEAREEGLVVPTLYLDSLPADFGRHVKGDQQKILFVQVLLPLILQENQNIRKEREKLLSIKSLIQQGYTLTFPQEKFLKDMAQKYRVENFSFDKLETLITRVDVIPVAMALGQAIEETGWGASYAARVKNSTFGVTLASGVKSYNSLGESVKSYMHILNTHPAYKKMRSIRSRLRDSGEDLSALRLMDGLQHYSELGQRYIHKVKKHIRQHNLDRFEAAQLEVS